MGRIFETPFSFFGKKKIIGTHLLHCKPNSLNCPPESSLAVHGIKILLGITGGIAAYKTPQLVRLLKKQGAETRVLLTENGSRFVSELTLATLSENPVLRSIFPGSGLVETDYTAHISLGEWPDLFVVAPVTANTLARFAAGMCDDMLTTAFITLRPGKPVLLFPAMDGGMFFSPSVQANIAVLRSRGYTVIDPECGELASGQHAQGRMPSPETIVEKIRYTLQCTERNSCLKDKKIVITAGPTREKIDAVRFISNYSSGKMGFAIATAAALRGASVSLVTGPVTLQTPRGVTRLDCETATDMHELAMKEGAECDVFIAAAAVADYRPETAVAGKIKKQGSAITLTLVQNPDIVASFAARKSPRQLAVGFALETTADLAEARKKLLAKQLDLIALNTCDMKLTGFDVDTNMLTLIDKAGTITPLPLLSKAEAAERLLDAIEELLMPATT